MSNEEFRRIRDELALAAYEQRWQRYVDREADLRRQIADLEKDARDRYPFDAKQRNILLDAVKHDKKGVYFELQAVSATLDAMERDIPIRRARLA